MTMIAITLNHNIPFVVGDLLFTATGNDEPIELPTQAHDLNERLIGSSMVPVDLIQKLYIIKPNLCIALACVSDAMQEFLEEVRMRSKYYGDWEIDDKVLHKFFNDFGFKKNFEKSAVCLMLLKGEPAMFQDIEILVPEHAWTRVENALFQRVFVCGSGSESYLRRMAIDSAIVSSHREGDFVYAIQNNINLFSRLLAEEKTTSHTTIDGWGAEFETIYFNGTSFVKFDNITYVVFESEFINDEGDIGELVPTVIMHYKYYGVTLLITSLNISGGTAMIDEDLTTIISDKITPVQHKVGTLYKDYADNENIPPDKSFTNERIAAGFAIRTKTGVHASAYYSDKDGAKISYSASSNQVEIILPSKSLDEVRHLSKAAFPNFIIY
jgi:hypothetical protein